MCPMGRQRERGLGVEFQEARERGAQLRILLGASRDGAVVAALEVEIPVAARCGCAAGRGVTLPGGRPRSESGQPGCPLR